MVPSGVRHNTCFAIYLLKCYEFAVVNLIHFSTSTRWVVSATDIRVTHNLLCIVQTCITVFNGKFYSFVTLLITIIFVTMRLDEIQSCV